MLLVRRLSTLALLLATALPAFAQQYAPPVAGMTPAPVYTPPITVTPPPPLPQPIYAPAPQMVAPCAACAADDASTLWLEADGLFWYIRGTPTPPLVTTGPSDGVRATTGAIGIDGTRILVGGENLNDQWTYGSLVRGGFWFDKEQREGVELGFFWLAPISQSYFVGGDNAVIARPFFDSEIEVEQARLVNFPGVVTGNVVADAKTRLLGGEASMVFNVFHCDDSPTEYRRLDFLFGYRYFHLDDRIFIEDRRTFVIDDELPAGTSAITRDRFATSNDIHAANLVFKYRWQSERLSLSIRTALGLGWLNAASNLDGLTLVSDAAGTTSTRRGFLIQGTNVGHHASQRFTFLPEVTLQAGYQLTDNLSVRIGWTALYATRVLRAGYQIDPRLNPTQFNGGTLVGEPVPTFRRDYSDFFLTGLLVGAEWRF